MPVARAADQLVAPRPPPLAAVRAALSGELGQRGGAWLVRARADVAEPVHERGRPVLDERDLLRGEPVAPAFDGCGGHGLGDLRVRPAEGAVPLAADHRLDDRARLQSGEREDALERRPGIADEVLVADVE